MSELRGEEGRVLSPVDLHVNHVRGASMLRVTTMEVEEGGRGRGGMERRERGSPPSLLTRNEE